MGAGKSVRNPLLRKTNPGKTAQKDAKGGCPGVHGTISPGEEHDDGDEHPKHLFPEGYSDPFHQGQLRAFGVPEFQDHSLRLLPRGRD